MSIRINKAYLIPVYLIIGLLAVCCKKQTASIPVPVPGGKTPEEDKITWLSPLKVASYNIEYDHDNQVTDNYWTDRKLLVKKMFDKYAFDIVGVQEPYLSQWQDMATLLPGYARIGQAVTGSTTIDKKLTVNIMYKKSRIEVLKQGVFWFSDTPSVPGIAASWGAEQWRICTWALVRDKLTNKQFYFFSVHLDFIPKEPEYKSVASTKSVELLLKQIPTIAKGYPAVLAGDFNFNQNTLYYQQLTAGNVFKDTYTLTDNIANAARGTFNNYDPNRVNASRIDHILVNTTEEVKVNNWAILPDTFIGKYPSDHSPVSIDLCFQEIIK
ncbi:endonuclease/exonuclease/phosphatase family protein [Pseudopedobacter beijingensis]|uniref:Endonuclease/exonuclease/phosphatase family protein n=1 Tax=Pseudopedobacter beijingensis TaxID=1207056 RepID=A0ABW4IE06_9SPHI